MKVWLLSTRRNAEILAESFSDYLQLCGLHCTFNLLAIGHLVCQCISCNLSAEEKVSTFFLRDQIAFHFQILSKLNVSLLIFTKILWSTIPLYRIFLWIWRLWSGFLDSFAKYVLDDNLLKFMFCEQLNQSICFALTIATTCSNAF